MTPLQAGIPILLHLHYIGHKTRDSSTILKKKTQHNIFMDPLWEMDHG